MTTNYQTIDTVKDNLVEALSKYQGDVKNQIVARAIEELAVLNPTPSPTENKSLLQGNWLLINAPNFPDRQEYKNHQYVYNLGKLAFNVFEPIKLKVAIQEVIQPMFATGAKDEYTHDIVVKFKTIDNDTPELEGIIKNLAICHPVNENTLEVQFTGGELIPANIKIEDWLSVFDPNNQSSISLRDRFNSWLIKWIFGIKNLSAIDKATGKRNFIMKKSPKGLLKILYLDKDLRITQGNRETILVCQRQS